MEFLEKALDELQGKRQIFHSEDDFKLSLAMIIKELNPKFEIRLERPVDLEMVDRKGAIIPVRAPIDIIVIDEQGKTYPIELKYKTKKLKVAIKEELYNLTDQSATDEGRYSFRKDIFRIENYKSRYSETFESGYVLIITNDELYSEKNVSKTDNTDKNYTFHNETTIDKEDLGWNLKIKNNTDIKNISEIEKETKKHWTCKKENNYRLDLSKNYKIKWYEYSKIENSTFKYCLIKIE